MNKINNPQDHQHTDYVLWIFIAFVACILISAAVAKTAYSFNDRLDYHRDYLCKQAAPGEGPRDCHKSSGAERIKELERLLRERSTP